MKAAKCIAMTLVLILVLSIVSPAMADSTPSIQPMSSGNGWVSSYIVKNGVSYLATASIALTTSSHEATTRFQTSCVCDRIHDKVTMRYNSSGSGVVTVYSSGVERYTDHAGESTSIPARPSSAYGSYISYVEIYGSVSIVVLNNDAQSKTYAFNPRLT